MQRNSELSGFSPQTIQTNGSILQNKQDYHNPAPLNINKNFECKIVTIFLPFIFITFVLDAQFSGLIYLVLLSTTTYIWLKSKKIIFNNTLI